MYIHNKYIKWHKSTQVYYLTVLEITTPKETYFAKIKEPKGTYDRTHVHVFQQSLTCFPWLMVSFLIFKASNVRSTSFHTAI